MNENFIHKNQENSLSLRHTVAIFATAMIILVVFDQITWNKQPGLQTLIITLLMLIGLLLLVLITKKRVPSSSYLLIIPILSGATMTTLQIEGQTRALNHLLVMVGFFLLAISLLNGQWLGFRIREVFIDGIFLLKSMFVDPVLLMIETIKLNKPKQQESTSSKHRFPPFLLGFIIAIPVLIIFTALFASADLIFKSQLVNLFSWISLENFVEFTFRTFYVVVLAYFLSGAYIHALFRSAEKEQLRPDNPLVPPFLGHIEAFTILVLVNLLFLGFIIIQFRYFFAGEANINLEGFTYAEYARRGFFELLAVAIISLGLYYLLSSITKRAEKVVKIIFSILGLMLILQVGLMLASAFQRLSLYEAAYGFTTQRTTTHIFMIWLAVLLAAAVLMEFSNRFRHLALVLFLVFFGFTFTINSINMDKFIASRNIQHAIDGNPLDVEYLMRQLSDDGIPVLFKYWQIPNTPQGVKDTLYATLACIHAQRNEDNIVQRETWVEWHPSYARAATLFEQYQVDLEAYPFTISSSDEFFVGSGEEEFVKDINIYSITVDDQEIWCKTDYPNIP